MKQEPSDNRAAVTRSRPKGAKRIEWLLWTCAALCLLPYMTTWAARSILSEVAKDSAQLHSLSAPVASEVGTVKKFPALISDRSVWSSQRILAFEKLKSAVSPDIVGTLELPSQNSLIPIFSGATEKHMTLGAAHLEDSAPLDSDGNIAVTSHRDGSFRVLKDFDVGELIVLRTGDHQRVYKVSRTLVVSPDQLEVLAPTDVPTLTLITCYPFYFVGSAPQRYILQAELLTTRKAEELSFAGHSAPISNERPLQPLSLTEE
jgi:sortase A